MSYHGVTATFSCRLVFEDMDVYIIFSCRVCQAMVPRKGVCDEENGKKQVTYPYFFEKRNQKVRSLRVGVRGARCGIGFVRGTCVERYGMLRCVAPLFSGISFSLVDAPCLIRYPYSDKAGCSHCGSLVKDHCGSDLLVPNLCQAGTSYLFGCQVFKCCAQCQALRRALWLSVGPCINETYNI